MSHGAPNGFSKISWELRTEFTNTHNSGITTARNHATRITPTAVVATRLTISKSLCQPSKSPRPRIPNQYSSASLRDSFSVSNVAVNTRTNSKTATADPYPTLYSVNTF